MRIVDTALATLPESLQVLRRAAASADAEALRAAAHKLKGGSGTYGARGLSLCAKELEMATAEGDLDAVPSLLEALEGEAARVIRALEALRT